MPQLDLLRLRQLFGDILPQEAVTVIKRSEVSSVMWRDLEKLAGSIARSVKFVGYSVATIDDASGAPVYLHIPAGSLMRDMVEAAADDCGPDTRARAIYVCDDEDNTTLRAILEGFKDT